MALGDPIQAKYRAPMQAVAKDLDKFFNGIVTGKDRKVGFVLMVFPYNEVSTGCNYISNGADRKDMIVLMKDLIKRFEGQPEIVGHG